MAGTRADVPFDMPKDPNWDLLAGALDNLGENVKRLTRAVESPPSGSPLGEAARTAARSPSNTSFGSSGSATHLPQGYQYAPYGSGASAQIPNPQPFPSPQPSGSSGKTPVPMPPMRWMPSANPNDPDHPYGRPNRSAGASVPMPPLRWINPPVQDTSKGAVWGAVAAAMGKFGLVVSAATIAVRTFASVTAGVSPNAAATMSESWTLAKNRQLAFLHPAAQGASLALQHSAERTGPPNLSQETKRFWGSVGYHFIPWGTRGLGGDYGGREKGAFESLRHAQGLGDLTQISTRNLWSTVKNSTILVNPFIAGALDSIGAGKHKDGKDRSVLEWMEDTSLGRYVWGKPRKEQGGLSSSLAGLPGGRFSSFEEYYDRMATTAMNMSENQAKILQDQLNLLKDSLPRIVEILDSRQPAFR